MAEIHLSADNFEKEVLQSSLPVMVDFWAPWCGPCRVIGPVVEELAGEYAGRVAVWKVNVDESGALAQQLNILSIPTIIFFKGGQIVDTSIGAVTKDVLVEKLSKLV